MKNTTTTCPIVSSRLQKIAGTFSGYPHAPRNYTVSALKEYHTLKKSQGVGGYIVATEWGCEYSYFDWSTRPIWD